LKSLNSGQISTWFLQLLLVDLSWEILISSLDKRKEKDSRLGEDNAGDWVIDRDATIDKARRPDKDRRLDKDKRPDKDSRRLSYTRFSSWLYQ
jgi:hypothetical protein